MKIKDQLNADTSLQFHFLFALSCSAAKVHELKRRLDLPASLHVWQCNDNPARVRQADDEGATEANANLGKHLVDVTWMPLSATPLVEKPKQGGEKCRACRG